MAALCSRSAPTATSRHTTTTRNLLWILARAIQRINWSARTAALNLAERQRLQREREEAERLLAEQRGLISELGIAPPSGRSRRARTRQRSLREAGETASDAVRSNPELRLPGNLPPELVRHYRELLRTYVIMGSGNLGGELARLAELLTAAGVTARQTMHLHLGVLEELPRPGGPKHAARHDPGRPAGPGDPRLSGRGLPAALRRAATPARRSSAPPRVGWGGSG